MPMSNPDNYSRLEVIRFWNSQTENLRMEANRVARAASRSRTTAGGWSSADAEYRRWLKDIIHGR